MHLVVRPEHLAAAATALSACAGRLDDAGLDFARTLHDAGPELGMRALAATAEALTTTEHAVHVLSGDVRALATALRALAAHYPQVDMTAVPR